MECPGVTSPKQPRTRTTKGDFVGFMHPSARQCLRSTSPSAPSTSPSSSPLPLPPHQFSKAILMISCFGICNDLYGFVASLAQPRFYPFRKSINPRKLSRVINLAVVTLLIHKLRRRACHGCLYKICEFEPVMPFFACISGRLRFHLKPMACQSLVEQPQRSQGQHSCPTC